jgi:hypothetical protein
MLADTYLGERPFIWLSGIEPVPPDNLFKPHDRVGGRVVESCGRKGGRECHGLVELATWKKVPQIKGRVRLVSFMLAKNDVTRRDLSDHRQRSVNCPVRSESNSSASKSTPSLLRYRKFPHDLSVE